MCARWVNIRHLSDRLKLHLGTLSRSKLEINDFHSRWAAPRWSDQIWLWRISFAKFLSPLESERRVRAWIWLFRELRPAAASACEALFPRFFFLLFYVTIHFPPQEIVKYEHGSSLSKALFRKEQKNCLVKRFGATSLPLLCHLLLAGYLFLWAWNRKKGVTYLLITSH